MATPEEIVDGYKRVALDDMKRASELFCQAVITGRDEDLLTAMLAHENASQRARHYFYVKGQAAEEAIAGPPNRLRMPQRTRTA